MRPHEGSGARGDLVVPALPDGPEFVICYVAAAKIGAVTAGIGTGRLTGLRRAEPPPPPFPRLVPHPLGRLGFATRLPVFPQTGRTCHVVPEWSPEAGLASVRCPPTRPRTPRSAWAGRAAA